MPKTKNIPPTKSSTKKMSNTKGLDFIKTQIFCLTIYIILFIVGCLVSLIFDIDYKFDYYVSLFIFALCSFLSGFVGGIKQKENGIVSGIIYALPGNLIVILLSVILNGFSVEIGLLISTVSLILLSAVGGILGVNKRRRR